MNILNIKEKKSCSNPVAQCNQSIVSQVTSPDTVHLFVFMKAVKAECNRMPTQANYDRLENTNQVMQRLKAQLNNPRSPSISEVRVSDELRVGALKCMTCCHECSFKCVVSGYEVLEFKFDISLVSVLMKFRCKLLFCHSNNSNLHVRVSCLQLRVGENEFTIALAS